MKYQTTKECDQEIVNIINSLHVEYEKNDQKLTEFMQELTKETMRERNAYVLAKDSYAASLEKFICSKFIEEKDFIGAKKEAFQDLVSNLWDCEKHDIAILEKIIQKHKNWLKHWRFEDLIAADLFAKVDYRYLRIASDEFEEESDATQQITPS